MTKITKIALSLILVIAMTFAVACQVVGGDNTGTSSGSQSQTGTNSGSQSQTGSNGSQNPSTQESIVTIDFYVMNDLHGMIEDSDTQPGVDEFTTYMFERYADTAAHEVLLSSGDMWQGSVESSSNKGALMTEWMNYVGFEAMTLGNHEYDWGGDAIAENAKNAEFPFLGINILVDGEPAPYCQPSVILERGGVKIGVIGAMGDVLSSISGEFTDDLYFVKGAELTLAVQKEAARLRNEENCDIVVYSLHEGFEDGYDTILSNKNSGRGYVDIVFEGHSHSRYKKVDEYGVYHIQGGGYNQAISYARFVVDKVNDSVRIQNPGYLTNNVYSSSTLTDDPIVDTLMDKYFPDSDPYNDILGYNRTYRSENAIVSKVAQLYLEKGLEFWGNDYQIVLGGGYLNTRKPYDLDAGNLTYADIFTILPFDNDLILGKIKGSDLTRNFIEKSTYTNAINGNLCDNIVSTQYYYIVVDSYTAFYSWNNITVVDRIPGLYARDLLSDFVAENGWA